jgi:hypothetical protein
MLDDLAILAAEDVDDRKTRIAGPAHRMHVHDDMVAVDERPVNGLPGTRARGTW